ncbi:MAG: S9 family peptidase [Deltaproteobacteria bacterium]|nr:S9 family peptidase [Deltaproteobacteria bacterium]
MRVRIDNGGTSVKQHYRLGVGSWAADHEGNIRIGGKFRDWTTEKSLHARATTDHSWEKLIEFDRFVEHGFWFAGFSEDPNLIYVYSDADTDRERDKTAVYTFDLSQNVLRDLIFEDTSHDLDTGYLLNSPTDGRLLAIHYYRERAEVHVVDPEWQRVWERAVRDFPGQNVYVRSWDATAKRMLLSVSSDRTPPGTYLYDSESGQIDKLFDSYPLLQHIEFSAMEPVRFEARDGREIHGYVTRPTDHEAPGPTIVVPHGGPRSRDVIEWDPVVQFLVQRGFTVFQLNFRGSSGYGREHERAGDHEWGGKIQDDIRDGVRWLVSQGIADPERIGIFGVGFGGYAALMGLVEYPALYKAGAVFGAITDLIKFTTGDARSRRIRINEYLIGRPLADRSRLIENSPVKQAANIRAAVLLGHGAENPSVDQAHTISMARALRRTGGTVDTHLYPAATHSFIDERDGIDFYRRVADLFERHLNPDVPEKGIPPRSIE